MKKNIKQMIDYLHLIDPTASDELKLSLLSWMWDNRYKIDSKQLQDDKFKFELLGFLKLITKRSI